MEALVMQEGLVLRGGRVIDPMNGVDAVRDLCISQGRIVAAPAPGAPVVDVSGLVVCPGFIDLHVHLREPGQTHKEDIGTGTRAAAAGGFTTVVAMPNTAPPVDSAEILAQVYGLARGKAAVRVLQSAALTLGRAGKELSDAAALAKAGAVALTDDGTCIQTAGLMLEAVRRAAAVGIPVIDHCEDESVARRGAMNAGAVARRLGVSSQPGLAEDLIVCRNLLVCRETGWPIHIQHISTAFSVAMVRAARREGLPITAEASPHHLCLTEECCATHGANAKMNPPLRTEADRQAVLAGLADGTIGVIASDHAPHTAAEKAAGMEKAPAGIVGLEALVSLCLTELVHGQVLTLPEFVAKLTAGPRTVLRLTQGTLSVGMPADVTLLNVNAEHILRVAEFHSRSTNCPYDGSVCRGRVEGTLIDGQWVFSRLPGIGGAVR
jgi:dihydroorotase